MMKGNMKEHSSMDAGEIEKKIKDALEILCKGNQECYKQNNML